MSRYLKFTIMNLGFKKKIISKICSMIKSYDNFLLCSHARSDGDATGSMLALYFILNKLGKKVDVACDKGINKEYQFLPGANKVNKAPQKLKKNYRAFFVIDCADFERLEKIKDILPPNIPNGAPLINIDHHASNTRFGTINWVDPSYAACGEMIYELAQYIGVEIDKRIAINLYVAIVFDTNRFQFSNTTSNSHIIAADLLTRGVKPARITGLLYRQKTPQQLALMAEFMNKIKIKKNVAWGHLTRDMMQRHNSYPQETQEFIDIVKSIKGVKVALLFRDLEDKKVKVSIRAEPGLNAYKFAQKFGGGGHPRAAGFTIEKSLQDAEKIVLNYLKRYLSLK